MKMVQVKPPRRSNGGFTLIEIMIVVVILAILATVVVSTGILNSPAKARVTVAKTNIKSISTALQLYKLDNYTYPTTQQGLKALVEKPTAPPVPANWNGPYMSKIPKDPWGQPYKYLYPGTHNMPFDLWTSGPPGASAGGDQSKVIGNWNLNEQSNG